MRDETSGGMLGTCFVVMGFGKKTDFETGRTLDLDKTYRNIIKPAAEAARLTCVRADEIVHSGMIDLPMYEQLLTADVVIADLSTSNKNAFYELGVRHALRPHTTIVIAEDGIKAFPFDINHVVVRQYHHLGEDIGYSEVMRFRDELTAAITKILASEPRQSDSPIYTILKNLAPPLRGDEKKEATTRSTRGTPPAPEIFDPPAMEPGPPLSASGSPYVPPPAPESNVMTYHSCMEKVDDAEQRGDFVTAKTLLDQVHANFKADNPNRADDPSLIQRRAFATYKSEHPSPLQAFKEASNILQVLNPETSNDPETLGLWGAINKRFWKETNDRSYLDRAVRAYSRGFYLRNDYYNGINYAHLLNVRGANASTRGEAIADFVEAERIRKEVLSICEPLLAHEYLSDANKYWVRATMAEAYVGLGDEEQARQKLEEADSFSPSEWMKETTEKRLVALRSFVDNSPLKFVNTE